MSAEINLLNEKLELIQWLSTIEDSSILQKISALRKSETRDWWNSISADEKISIELGIEDANSGNVTSHSEAKKLYEKWL